MNYIYLRVSKEEETLQDLDIQEVKLKEKYPELIDAITLKERGSAYDLKQFHKRTEFIELINTSIKAKDTSILDIFTTNYKPTDIIIGVWDYSRIMRNLELGLLSSILFKLFNVTIYSYKQGVIKFEENEIPVTRFTKYILASANSFEAESYSWNTSENIKKSINKTSDITMSNKGNKWGSQFRDTEGKNIKLDLKEIESLNRRIMWLIKKYEESKTYGYYPLIIEDIKREKGVLISKAYITGLKHEKTM